MGPCPALAASRGISSGSTVWWNVPDDLIESAQDLFLPTTMAQVLQVLSVRVMAIAQPSPAQPPPTSIMGTLAGALTMEWHWDVS